MGDGNEDRQPKEEARVVIGLVKDLMKDKSIEVRCPANKTLFCKILIGRGLLENLCRKCTVKWQALSKNKDVFVYHRFSLGRDGNFKIGQLVETVIVEKGAERIIEKKEVKN